MPSKEEDGGSQPWAGKWQWSDGSPWDYDAWNAGSNEPNLNKENQFYANKASQGSWASRANSDLYGTVCKYEL